MIVFCYIQVFHVKIPDYIRMIRQLTRFRIALSFGFVEMSRRDASLIPFARSGASAKRPYRTAFIWACCFV